MGGYFERNTEADGGGGGPQGGPLELAQHGEMKVG